MDLFLSFIIWLNLDQLASPCRLPFRLARVFHYFKKCCSEHPHPQDDQGIPSCGTFEVIQGCAQSGKNLNCQKCTFSAEVKQSNAFLFQLSCCKKNVISVVYLVPHFYWWFCYLKWPPRVVLKCCLVFPSARRLDVPHRESPCVREVLFRHEFNANEPTVY